MRELREARGWKLLDLSIETRMDTSKLSRIERSVPGGGARAETVARIAQALETSSDYLLNLTDDPKPRSR